jgi:hypothetical protein
MLRSKRSFRVGLLGPLSALCGHSFQSQRMSALRPQQASKPSAAASPEQIPRRERSASRFRHKAAVWARLSAAAQHCPKLPFVRRAAWKGPQGLLTGQTRHSP